MRSGSTDRTLTKANGIALSSHCKVMMYVTKHNRTFFDLLAYQPLQKPPSSLQQYSTTCSAKVKPHKLINTIIVTGRKHRTLCRSEYIVSDELPEKIFSVMQMKLFC